MGESLTTRSISPSDTWNRMSRTGKSRLMVVKDKQLLGMLSLSDLMQFLALKFDLERGSR